MIYKNKLHVYPWELIMHLWWLIFCYECEFMKNLSKSNDLNLIEKFNISFRYLDDLCSLDNSLFHTYIKNIYPKELILLQSNNSDDKATFLDLYVQINNLHCTRFMTREMILILILSTSLIWMATFPKVHRMELTCLS